MPLARQTLCSSSALAVSRAGASQAESGPTIAREKLLPDWRADAWRRLEGSWRGSWACVAETSGWLYAACDLPSCATAPVSAAPAKANHPLRGGPFGKCSHATATGWQRPLLPPAYASRFQRLCCTRP